MPTSSANTEQDSARKLTNRARVGFWAGDCRYEVILDNARKLQWKILRDEKHESKANVFWVDVSSIGERLRAVQPWQVVNHFPGMVIQSIYSN